MASALFIPIFLILTGLFGAKSQMEVSKKKVPSKIVVEGK